MGLDHAILRAFALVLLGAALTLPGSAQGADDPKKPAVKEKSDGVEWKKIATLTGKAPAAADGGYYSGSQKFSTQEKALKIKVSMVSLQGKGGNAKLTLIRDGKPPKKYFNITLTRPGDEEKAVMVEPGDFRIEVVVNNVDITVTIEEGKKSK